MVELALCHSLKKDWHIAAPAMPEVAVLNGRLNFGAYKIIVKKEASSLAWHEGSYRCHSAWEDYWLTCSAGLCLNCSTYSKQYYNECMRYKQY